MRNHFCRISFFCAFLLLASNVANAQSYTITITPPEKAPASEVTDEEVDDGWNYHLPNRDPGFIGFIQPSYSMGYGMNYAPPRMMFFPTVARPRVWTNPNLKMRVKVKQSIK